MDRLIETLFPVLTLVIGYLLNVWVGALESRRNVRARRVADKEKAYASISSKLHEIFDVYQQIVSLDNTYMFNQMENPKQSEGSLKISQKFSELKNLVFEQSLYLSPKIIQLLLDLESEDFIAIINFFSEIPTPSERIEFNTKHANELWSRAKNIMSQMRTELGLEPYPDEVLKIGGGSFS